MIGIRFSKKLHIDQDNYKEVTNGVQKLIRTKKKAYFESKLTENIGKLKELWKSLKSLGLKFESSISNIEYIISNCKTKSNINSSLENDKF